MNILKNNIPIIVVNINPNDVIIGLRRLISCACIKLI